MANEKINGMVERRDAEASTSGTSTWQGGGLGQREVERYARQLVMPKFGLEGQTKLRSAKVLVVGAGGLGSPVCLYLAAAGIGTLGVVDQDQVETSNLHRQILHGEEQVGVHKSLSAKIAVNRINSNTKVETHLDGFRPQGALQLVSRYDVVVDASDNPATRYCINDACVIMGKPLVSGAAIGTDGQLSVYNYGEGCPCYRCIWPDPPSEGSCQRCSDAGVLGVLPGIIGTLQALEAIKVVSGVGECCTQKLLMFDGMCTSFRTLKLRPRQEKCIVCGDQPAITADNFAQYDYEGHCGGPMHDKGGLCLRILEDDHRISCETLKRRMESKAGKPFVLIDVRPRVEYDFASLSGSINIPMDVLEGKLENCSVGADSDSSSSLKKLFEDMEGAVLLSKGDEEDEDATPSLLQPPDLYVVCRRGNDSQVAVQKLLKLGISNAFDLEGGLQQWSNQVDSTFPIY